VWHHGDARPVPPPASRKRPRPALPRKLAGEVIEPVVLRVHAVVPREVLSGGAGTIAAERSSALLARAKSGVSETPLSSRFESPATSVPVAEATALAEARRAAVDEQPR